MTARDDDQNAGVVPAYGDLKPSRRLSPDQARSTRFSRSALTRRGLDEEEVYQFTLRLADELGARDAEITRLLDQNRRLKQAMRDWHSRQQGDRGEGEPTTTIDLQERVTADTAALMAQAQQHIDNQLAQAELYCRRREEEALERYDQIVQEARMKAKAEAEQVAHQYRAAAGANYSSEQEQVRRQQVYLTALLRSLDALATHLYATRQAFVAEVEKLSGGPPGQPTTTSKASSSGTRQPGSEGAGAG